MKSTKDGKGRDTDEANGRGEPHTEAPQWKSHLDCYRDLRALTFKDQADLDAAIDLLWTDALRDLPHDLAGSDTIIVPAEAVRYFKEKGLRFRSTEVLSAGDLPPEEISKLRRNQGPY